MGQNSFFMLYMEGGDAPTYKHPTLSSAKTEAERLAKLFGKKIYILCTYQSVQLNEFKTEECIPNEVPIELPF